VLTEKKLRSESKTCFYKIQIKRPAQGPAHRELPRYAHPPLRKYKD